MESKVQKLQNFHNSKRRMTTRVLNKELDLVEDALLIIQHNLTKEERQLEDSLQEIRQLNKLSDNLTWHFYIPPSQ